MFDRHELIGRAPRKNAIDIAMFVVWAAVFACDAVVAQRPTPDGVLILHSNQRPTPAAVVIEDTLRSVVPRGLQRDVEIYSEYLEVERGISPVYAGAQSELLRQKYKDRNLRVVVASGPEAFPFVTQIHEHAFPNLPVVHIAVPADRLEGLALPPDFVGRTVDLDPTATLQLALRLQPNATRVVVVVGAAQRDRVWERRLRASVARLGDGIQSEFLSGLSTAEVLRRLKSLPPGTGTVVFTPGYFVDGAGALVSPRQSVETIAAASVAPVYAALDTHIGAGVVGGYMTPYDEQARQAADVVVRLLNGATPSEIRTIPLPVVPILDWRQLKRWGLNEHLLPADAVVRFREPTAWESYWDEIVAVIIVVLLQAGLIAALLLERRLRRRTASALANSEQQMNIAASAARLSMWTWDVEPEKARAIVPGRPARTQGQEGSIRFHDVLEAAHPADREHLDRSVRKALASGEELNVEYRVIAPDGNVRWIDARGQADNVDQLRLRGLTLDITARKIAELQAETDRSALTHMTRVSMMGQLSASIAHQLNQPLAAILGNAETARRMLEREQIDLAELKEICDDIVAEDKRAAEVIRRLGALYKRGELKLTMLDLNELVLETLDLVRTELLTRHVAVVTDLAPDIPTIYGGRIQLQQVLLNLILNAADAMDAIDPGERTLTVRSGHDRASVHVCVIDRGTGVAPLDIGNVFDPFWSTKPGGIGIGLAICQSIINAHHGTLTASNNADRGATFCAEWPMKILE